MRNPLRKLIRHVEGVQKAGLYMAEKLIEEGREEFSRELIGNCMSHDKEKFTGYMWNEIVMEGKNFTKAVKVHRSRSKHHPEHWNGINDMPEVYLAEMVCDWYARSCEKGAEFNSWIEEVPKNWNPSPETLSKIKYFKDLLIENYTWVRI